MLEGVFIRCMGTIFLILPVRKWGILGKMCISSKKIMFFLHIAPRQALSICHTWSCSGKLGFSTTIYLAVIKSKSKAPLNYCKASQPTAAHYTASVFSKCWNFIPSLHSLCAASGVRRAWSDWSRYSIQVGTYLHKKVYLLTYIHWGNQWCGKEMR